MDYLVQRISGKRVLDIGVVSFTMDYVSKKGWRHAIVAQHARYYLGLDILEESVWKLSELGYNVRAADATSDADLGERFDIVFIGDVVEYVDNTGSLLFTLLTPILNKHPTVHLDIFGSGGYASVRDLRRTLRPAADQIRFWGHQHDVRSVYSQLGYLMTGLPEKEALGLNVIEAQACGTPVLAVNAPPFTETVVENETGNFFIDPRQDDGRDFARLLGELHTADGKFPDPRRARTHLERFSLTQFSQRVKRAMDAATYLLEVTPCS